jgi:hypothetical protein
VDLEFKVPELKVPGFRIPELRVPDSAEFKSCIKIEILLKDRN